MAKGTGTGKVRSMGGAAKRLKELESYLGDRKPSKSQRVALSGMRKLNSGGKLSAAEKRAVAGHVGKGAAEASGGRAPRKAKKAKKTAKKVIKKASKKR